MKTRFAFLNLCLVCVTLQAHASLTHEMTDFLHGMGEKSNVSGPSAYQGQRAGFYSGGSLFVRYPVQSVPLAQLELPRLKTGCGGIDLYTGGFSFINGRGMATLMHNILHGASGYVTELALEQTMPQATNVMRHMQDIAHQVNQFNINACHAASQRVGSQLQKMNEHEMHVCQLVALEQGIARSWTSASQLCANPQQRYHILEKAKKQRSYRDSVITNTNIVWQALQRERFFKQHTELAQLLLTLTGSVIITEQHIKQLPARTHDTALLKGLLHGGEARVYQCHDTTQCLQPRLTTKRIAPEEGLANHIVTLLSSMTTHIKHDTPLNNEEKQLLNSTTLPLYKMLNIQAVLPTQNMQLDIASLADVIAIDILEHFLTENLMILKAELQRGDYPPQLMQSVMHRLDNAINQLHQHTISAYKRLQLTHNVIQRTKLTEQMLAAMLVNHV